MPEHLVPARYRDRAGVWHDLHVRRGPDGAWQIIDRCPRETQLVDTLPGHPEGRAEGEALARDYARQHHHRPRPVKAARRRPDPLRRLTGANRATEQERHA